MHQPLKVAVPRPRVPVLLSGPIHMYACAPARFAELKWGTSSSKLSQSAKGSSSYYVQDYFFNPALNISGLTDAQFNYTSASLHSVRLGGLTPGARYYYCLSE